MCWVQIETASGLARSSSSATDSVQIGTPLSSASLRAFAATTSQVATSSTRSSAWSASAWYLLMPPQPMMAMRSLLLICGPRSGG